VTTSLRVEDVLEFIVNAVTRTVRAEGGALFLWDEREERLVMRAVVGAPPELVGRVKYRSGEGLVGWVFLERRPANVSDVAADPRWKREPEQESALSSGRIDGALIVPLTVGEKILGTLSAANKVGAPGFTESDESLLTALAGQAAVAIDNATLFNDLQRSNVELALAYDTTIEGWSRALDLRDKETEGHTQRVTEITVRLARAMGMTDAELVHARRGALLHDIGKMGIPDGILLKPDKLTDAEWEIMRQHPQLALNMLSPISYLRLALDIPYCHHEKWDGTGYPRALKGEQIPLVARIFAVVDVWDAVTSDRPYRAAWSKEKALEHIREQSGKHFDPQIVQVFVRVVDIAKNNT